LSRKYFYKDFQFSIEIEREGGIKERGGEEREGGK